MVSSHGSSTEILRFAETVRIGRAETNAIVVTDDIVSPEHVELRKSDDGWEIIDLAAHTGRSSAATASLAHRSAHRRRYDWGSTVPS